jgi:predicted dehydrogenase
MTEATAQIKSVADQANKVVKIMAADWKVLRDTPFRRFPWHKALKLDKEVKDELADPAIHAFDAIRNLVDGGVITTDTAQGQTVEALLRSYKKEPGDSVADLLNAATRAAHEELMDDIARDVLERRAGALLPVLARVARAEAPKMMPIP